MTDTFSPVRPTAAAPASGASRGGPPAAAAGAGAQGGARGTMGGGAAGRGGDAGRGASGGAGGSSSSGGRGCGRGPGDGDGGDIPHMVEGTGLRTYSMSNEDVRRWYHQQLDLIPSRIDQSLPQRDQGLQAFQLRNEIKMQARELMSDRELAEKLPAEKTLKEAIRDIYHEGRGEVGDALWEVLMSKSGKTNKEVDKSFGITRD